MSTKNMKKLILIIVEGRSDEVYLYPVKRLVKSRSNNRVEFKVMRGDILVETNTNSKNIIEKVENTIKEYLKLYGLEYDDIKQVVHIVDLDGSFINPNNVETDNLLPKGKTVYYRDKITNVNRNNIIQRNKKKVECLNVLYNIDSVNYGTTPYRVYYFSTNIDDYFFGKQNLTSDEKKSFSNLIFDRYIDNYEEYRTMIESNYCAPGNYIETWKYAKIKNHSLSRCTNFNKIFTEIIDRL